MTQGAVPAGASSSRSAPPMPRSTSSSRPPRPRRPLLRRARVRAHALADSTDVERRRKIAVSGARSRTRDGGREEEERAVDIELAPQRIFALKDQLSAEEVRVKAMDRRATAISSGIGGLLQRPKADDITLLASQRRVEPFWHVAGHA